MPDMQRWRDTNSSVMIEANDMDVAVIDTSVMPSLVELGLEKMWVAFGKGENSNMTFLP